MLRLWFAMGVGVAFLIASGVVSSMARAQASGDPAAVITAYEMARNRQDVDAALNFFADDAVISQRNTSFSGKDEIRKFLDTSAGRSRFIVVSDRHSSGNLVTWTERSGSQATGVSGRPPFSGTGQTPSASSGQSQNAGPGFNAARGSNSPQSPNSPNTGFPPQTGFAVTVEAVVQDGKIQSMSYTFGAQVARVDPSLDGRAQLPAGLGLAVVLGVLLSVLMIASIGLGRTAPAASTLRGRLMQDLQGWAAARE